jgi:TPR repeat protein
MTAHHLLASLVKRGKDWGMLGLLLEDDGRMTEIESDLDRAWRAMEARNYAEAARLFEPLAARGSETALLNLGWMYKNGHLGPPDREKAMSFWEKAASAGSASARHHMGRALMESGDLQRARALFIEGANQGNKACMSMAGKMLVRGRGGEVSHDAGVAWLTRAADDGHAHARRELLRLDMQSSRSLPRRLWLWWKVILLAFATFFRALRNRYSDDFR